LNTFITSHHLKDKYKKCLALYEYQIYDSAREAEERVDDLNVTFYTYNISSHDAKT
jgi:hypothetical protein